MKIRLNDTTVGQSSNIDNYAKNARAFLVDNVDHITFNHDEQKQLFKTQDRMLRTVVSALYDQASEEGVMDIFTLLNLDHVRQIPSWFLISWLDLDVKELQTTDPQSYRILTTIPQYRDKILVDITPFYSSKRHTITDTSNYYSRVVRNLLTRSYHQFDRLWLSPQLIYLLTKFYAMVLSSKIARVYSLNFQEQHLVATILAVYFTNHCSDIPDTINPIMGKMEFLTRAVETKPVFEYIKEKYDVKSFDLTAVVDTIVELGPSRINKFNLSTFRSMNASLTSNQLISLISLEYPPYWAYLIISALSGDKSNIYHTLKSLNLRRESTEFQSEIVKTKSFIRSLGV